VTVVILLIKVSALFGLVLACLPLLRRSTAAVRHLTCVMALSGALVFPLTLAFEARALPIHVPVTFAVSAATAGGAAPRSIAVVEMLGALWALGSLLLLARLALGYRRIAQVMETAERTADRDPVYLADVSAPLLCGLFETAILLPRASVSWSAEQRTAALRHELAHKERKDLFTGLLGHLACAAYWFHPLAWAIVRRMRDEQEAACDDAVLSSGFAPDIYAEALVATARQLTSTSLIGCHMLTPQTLKTRIARLLDHSLPRTSSTAALGRTAVISAGLLAAIGLIYADAPQAAPPQARDEKVYKMGEGMTPPRVLRKIDPQYPDEARDAKIEGTVLLSVVIGTDGLAHDINVVTTPDSGLGVKAVEAVEQWKFQPGSKDGEPVAVRAQIEVNFKLM
jgi:TonB family protein